VFTAEGPATESNARLAGLLLGSTVELTGVCMPRLAEDGALEAVHLLLPSEDSVRVVREPSWLTPQRLLTGLALSAGVLVMAAAWIVTVSRKNVALRTLIHDREKAQAELQQAHDLLDERVRERTEQLKFEVNERKQAEVRFRATLAERTRLARQLHDTTEQSLTGISLQLDTAAKLIDKGEAGATRPLEVARTLMTRSRDELRQSIWDLRSRELEQFDLARALEMNAREILDGTGVELVFEATGDSVALSEVVEESLLRIGGEAVSNVIRHAAAGRLAIMLSFGRDTVRLEVSDDGCGFEPASAPGPREGHFGLLGISERIKQLDGTLELVSSSGEGTRIAVEVPVHPGGGIDPGGDTRARI
jgi:signal transduction histidine kinase